MKHLKKFKVNENNNKDFFSSNMPSFISSEYDIKYTNITELLGKVIIDIKYDSHSLLLKLYDYDEREIYINFIHQQDCCEYVWLDDIVGHLEDLINSPILKAEEKTSKEGDLPKNGYLDVSSTWTFYTLATIKGYVDFRWIGTSNGYYSESVNVIKITEI